MTMRSKLSLKGSITALVTPFKNGGIDEDGFRTHVDWQINIYGGAVHSFTNPDADKHGIPGIAYNAQADHRSWEAMQRFFNERFKGPSSEK